MPTIWRILPVSKWLISKITKSPDWGYSLSKWHKWLKNGGDPNYLLNGMILQAVALCFHKTSPSFLDFLANALRAPVIEFWG